MTCADCEERLSQYLEDTLRGVERSALEVHLQSCAACSALVAEMKEVIAWGKTFPAYEPPVWLPHRILANTPVIARESWLDTLSSIGRWIIAPRIAMAIFTAVLVFGWLGNIAGISPDWSAILQDPVEAAIRAYYRSPLVSQIQSRIEQFMEIS